MCRPGWRHPGEPMRYYAVHRGLRFRVGPVHPYGGTRVWEDRNPEPT
jgi:hypothetical protein